MAEFQWWLLLVGLVAGGGLVAIVSMDGRRRDEDINELEQRAEATWIADRLVGLARDLEPRTVESVLRAHREYLSLPPPDRVGVAGDPLEPVGDSDQDPDRAPDDVRDDGSRGADQNLAAAREDEAPAGEEAHAGTHGEEGHDR